MDTIKEEEVIINLKLLKRCHFYQIFDPGQRKVFGWNSYRLFYIGYFSVVQCFFVYGSWGLFFESGDEGVNNDYSLLFFTNLNIQLSFWRLFVYMYNANNVTELLYASRIDFFKSKTCVDHKDSLHKIYHNMYGKLTNGYAIFSMFILLQWFIFPIMINILSTSESSNIRFQNVLNLNYGVSTETFNHYFAIFYSIETFITTFSVYCYIMTDLLIISFCSAMMSQQEVLIEAFKKIGHDDNPQTSYFEELKSILHDQVQLNVRIKSFFLVVKQIVLITVACSSASIILLTYRFIVVYSKFGPDTILSLFKIGSTAIYTYIELYIYCRLFDNMNTQRELVNFSLYSCNWTQMDLKLKKLVLLAMRMNDANNLVIKASSRKIINLQVFASIMSMSYYVISVMLKTTNMKNEISE